MKWFTFQAKGEQNVEISIFDEIGMWGVSAKAFIAELKQHAGKKITCYINSPGGSVFDALAIYNALRANGAEITTKVIRRKGSARQDHPAHPPPKSPPPSSPTQTP